MLDRILLNMIPSKPVKIDLSDDCILGASAQNDINDKVVQNKCQSETSYIQLVRIAKTIKMVAPDQQVFVNHRSIKRNAKQRFKSILFIKCNKCQVFSKNGYCEQCKVDQKKDENDYFIYIPLRQQINHYLQIII